MASDQKPIAEDINKTRRGPVFMRYDQHGDIIVTYDRGMSKTDRGFGINPIYHPEMMNLALPFVFGF